ncbi:MAG: lamin tail domain-containing protein, partial [Chloroflexi bacterium]|nr:lamin tail domain-containing protein [Chloroflexota bacterium]
VAYLQDQGLDDIEVLVLTHGDADHVGGLIAVLQSAIPVEQVFYNGLDHTTATYAAFQAELQHRGLTPVPAQAGQTYIWGPLDAAVLNPQVPGTGDQNEDSVVLAVTYGAVRWLFTGDIGSATEQTILLSDTLRAGATADVLKVAHHGSRYSSTTPFLDAVGAELAVICVGADNTYGHPAEETLARLRAAGARILRTDQNNTVVVRTDGQTFQVQADYLLFLPLALNRWVSSAQTGDVHIADIFRDGAIDPQEPDEYVEIYNADPRPIQLDGWTLRDEANHVFTFPNYVMPPDQVCRIYTNQDHPEWCGFSYGNGWAIWNNDGDCAYLHDSTGTLVDAYCY